MPRAKYYRNISLVHNIEPGALWQWHESGKLLLVDADQTVFAKLDEQFEEQK